MQKIHNGRSHSMVCLPGSLFLTIDGWGLSLQHPSSLPYRLSCCHTAVELSSFSRETVAAWIGLVAKTRIGRSHTIVSVCSVAGPCQVAQSWGVGGGVTNGNGVRQVTNSKCRRHRRLTENSNQKKNQTQKIFSAFSQQYSLIYKSESVKYLNRHWIRFNLQYSQYKFILNSIGQDTKIEL